MNKILLIIQREYVTRVRKRAFIVMIFLVPCLILLMSGAIALVAKSSSELTDKQTVKIIDGSGIFTEKFHDGKNIHFEAAAQPLRAIKEELKNNDNEVALVIPASFTKLKKETVVCTHR